MVAPITPWHFGLQIRCLINFPSKTAAQKRARWGCAGTIGGMICSAIQLSFLRQSTVDFWSEDNGQNLGVLLTDYGKLQAHSRLNVAFQ